jgi:hypothetical protein
MKDVKEDGIVTTTTGHRYSITIIQVMKATENCRCGSTQPLETLGSVASS